MLSLMSRFKADETGNSTVDWMVLTAGIVMLASAVMATVGSSANEVADDTGKVIESRGVGT